MLREAKPLLAAWADGETISRTLSVPTNTQWCYQVMDCAARDFGATIATLDPDELEEIIFGIIPSEESIDASEASTIIDTIRAFFAYIKREDWLTQADDCLTVLGGDAVEELEAALSDPTGFAPAKSVIREGKEASYDMTSPEGINAWLSVVAARPLLACVRLPPLRSVPRPVEKGAWRAKEMQRKATRKARKKNR